MNCRALNPNPKPKLGFLPRPPNYPLISPTLLGGVLVRLETWYWVEDPESPIPLNFLECTLNKKGIHAYSDLSYTP